MLQGLGIEFETVPYNILDVHHILIYPIFFGAKIQTFAYIFSIIDKPIVGLRLIIDKQVAGQLPVNLHPIARSQGGAGRVTGTVRAEGTTIGRPATQQSSTTIRVEQQAVADRAQRARAGQRARRGTKTDIAKWRCSLLDKRQILSTSRFCFTLRII